MKRTHCRQTLCGLILAFLILFLHPPAMQAQSQAATGQIRGTITDATGGVLPGVSVTVKSKETGITRVFIADDRGYYRALLLPVGEYDLTAELSGFSTATKTGILVTVGQQVTLDLTLAVAGTEQQITVTSEVPVVETTRTQVSSTVNDLAVANLPVNGRNFIDFVLLTPGVTRDPRGGDISFGGQRGTLNSLQIDGVDNNNTFFGQSLGRTGSGRAPYQFSQDAVREFQVNSNGYSAEFGRAGGAVINVVTKSGTNDFHGTGFWFYRDRALNANQFFNNARNAPKPPFHINQFGGNIGGPIVKEKAFFFFDYDGQRQTLPNDILLPPNLPPGPGLELLRPLAQSYTRTFDQDVYLVKGDWQIDTKNSLTARFNHQKFIGGNLENSGPRSALEHTGNSTVTTDTFTVSLASTLTAKLVNEARFQFARDREPGFANSDRPEANINQAGNLVLSIGRNNFSPRETTIRRYQMVDSASYLAGLHGLKFGADINIDRIKNFFPGQFGGQYQFSSLDQFAAGRPDSYVQAFAGEGTTGPLTFPHSYEVAFFIQDDWRVTPRFTVNLGLRYDNQKLKDPPTRNPDPGLAGLGLRTDRINRDNNNFAPRIGVAWNPLASNKLVVRAGYGIFYGRTPAIMAAQAHSQNAINVRNIEFTGADVPTYPQRFATPPPAGRPQPFNIFVFSPNYVNPYVQQGSLGLEYELLPNFSVSGTYLFVKGTHLQRTRNINLLPPIVTPIEVVGEGFRTFLRFPSVGALPNFRRISQFESTANSQYHGFAFQANKRFSNHFQMLLSYTVSKTIDDTPDATAVVVGTDDAKVVQNNLDLGDDRALSVTHVPQRLVISGLWEIPYARALANPVARALLDGWSLSGILTAQSGSPYSALVGSDLNNDTNRLTDRVPPFGRNTFRGFRFVSLDPRITRDIRLHEKTKLQFIFEAFNFLNRTNFSTINTTRNSLMGGQLRPSPIFGTPSNTSDPRIIQLALKIVF